MLLAVGASPLQEGNSLRSTNLSASMRLPRLRPRPPPAPSPPPSRYAAKSMSSTKKVRPPLPPEMLTYAQRRATINLYCDDEDPDDPGEVIDTSPHPGPPPVGRSAAPAQAASAASAGSQFVGDAHHS